MGAKGNEFEPFHGSKDLAAEHATIQKWLDEATSNLDGARWNHQVDLKNDANGRLILDAPPDQAKRYVVAAIERRRHHIVEVADLRAQAKTDFDRDNVHLLPAWQHILVRQFHLRALLIALMRRSLPFDEKDLIAILDC